MVTTSNFNPFNTKPLSLFFPKIIGFPCSTNNCLSSRIFLSVYWLKQPSLKITQFCNTSINEVPLNVSASINICVISFGVFPPILAKNLARAPMANSPG